MELTDVPTSDRVIHHCVPRELMVGDYRRLRVLRRVLGRVLLGIAGLIVKVLIIVHHIVHLSVPHGRCAIHLKGLLLLLALATLDISDDVCFSLANGHVMSLDQLDVDHDFFYRVRLFAFDDHPSWRQFPPLSEQSADDIVDRTGRTQDIVFVDHSVVIREVSQFLFLFKR